MKTSQRLWLSAAFLAAPLSLAQPPADSPATPAESRPQDTFQLQFRGTLRDAIQKIAEEGGLNVVVTGALDTPADVHLKNVSAEQALRTVARAYSLKLEQDGGIYTLRAMTAEEKAQAPVIAPPPLPVAAPTPTLSPPSAIAESSMLDEDEVKERVRDQMKKLRRSKKGSQDVVARGHSLEVKEGETVDSAVVYGGNLVVKGNVEEDAVVFGGNLEITGRVEGDARAFGGNVVLGPNAYVEGDVSSFGGSVTKEQGAQVEGSTESFGGAGIGRTVAGEIKESLREARQKDSDAHEERGGRLASFLLKFAMLFGMGFLGQLFFPSRMKALGTEIRNEPVKSGLMGLLGAVALVPVLLVLSVTIIGIPLALVLALVVPILTVWGFAAVASELGARLPLRPAKKTQAMVLALGLLILLVLGHLPVLGNLVMVLASLVALGAVMRTRFGNRSQGLPEPLFHDEHVRG
ncbi:bactofilin family protein [Melittangium boletus]|uniref:DUF8173 domain-containing protein n=1 Tax=Melittangium boletus DSM 14713 TaxID=1294270 RepID=A0A250IS05_9BACT|nr:polymer-forming cytoskeletal protein [Melittangium boletus]ATB34030.1 hypothetical protein MEBOL_007531 [Melittangium boletus DSM 14713]